MICTICQADGIVEVLGGCYCGDHIDVGFMDLALYLARLRGWDENETEAALADWLDGQSDPADEEDDEDDDEDEDE